MNKPIYRRLKKDGKPFAPTLSGYRLLRQKDGTPYMLYVGKINSKKKKENSK